MYNNKKVMLAMSGGTDSSMSAILLIEEGYEVIGITYYLSDEDNKEYPSYIIEAKSLCEKINIEHFVVDLRDQFQSDIINYFEKEYLDGKTPNPCVMCNEKIKWPYLEFYADKNRCSYISTGHYAKISKYKNKYYIKEGCDVWKEQSFFLWNVDQKYLRRAIFPLGKYTKEQIREMASQRGFEKVAKKKDSMGVCFLNSIDYREYLKSAFSKKNIFIEKGSFVNDQREKIGDHEGYCYYTIGQRRGLGINVNKALYVTKIDPICNEITLGDKVDLRVKELTLERCHVISEEILYNQKIEIRIRYRKQFVTGSVNKVGKLHKVSLDEWEVTEPSGQSATFYWNGIVVGGGWII